MTSNTKNSNEAQGELSRALVIMLALACGLAVANIYYNQPLLMLFAQTFHCSNASASLVPTVVQISYAIGLILFAPLGDKMNRRKLIIILLIINICGLILAAIAPKFEVLIVANIIIGLTSVSAQLIIPAASVLASPLSRGKVIGTVMSGLFAGILLARTVSGFVGEYAGWRAMYWIATGLDIILIMVIYTKLPQNIASINISYKRLLYSMWELLKTEPVLRNASVAGFLLFAAFSALWGTLAFLLSQAPYHFNSGIVGSFGLVGILGMLASPTIGAFAGKFGGRRIVSIGAIITAIAFIFIWQAQSHLWALIFGITLLDIGGRMGLVGNQVRLYTLAPEIRSRLNTIFMSCYFIGGAVGTRFGAAAGSYAGWLGIAVLGGALALLLAITQSIFETK
jgi:predicted MFS family arabinose efflux permease